MNNKQITLVEQIAERHLNKFTIWKEQRLYIKECRFASIYNTRKCKQSVYIDLSTFEVRAYTDCPIQSAQWCKNENARLEKELAAFARLLRIACGPQVSAEPIEVVMHNALLDAQDVKGYTTDWQVTKVPINAYGKLAMRNRQFVHPYVGTKATAPASFVPLSDKAFAYLQRLAGTDGFMLAPYQEVPDFEHLAQLEETRTNAEKMRAEQQQQEWTGKKATIIAAMKVCGGMLKDYYNAEFKKAHNLSWSELKAIMKEAFPEQWEAMKRGFKG